MALDIKKRSKTVIGKTLGIVLAPIESALTYIFMRNLRLHRKLATNVSLSGEWREIMIDPPIKIKKGFQEIELFFEEYGLTDNELVDLEESGEIDFSKAILRDGTVINPRVQIKDEFGEVYNLTYQWQAHCVCFREELPRDRKFVQLDLSCVPPIICTTVRWHDYNLK